MEHVSQETLKSVIMKYFTLFDDKDYFVSLVIKSAHPTLGNALQIETIIYKKTTDYKITMSFNDNSDTISIKDKTELKEFVDDITDILYIGINIKYQYPLLFPLYENHLLLVYPGDDCLDKNLVARVKLYSDFIYLYRELSYVATCINTLKDIKSIKIENKRLKTKFKEQKQTPLPETNPYNEAIVKLALNTLSFGDENLFKHYMNSLEEITHGSVSEYVQEPLFLESCNGVINLVRNLERVKEIMEKIKQLRYKQLDEEINQLNKKKALNEKRKGILKLATYLENLKIEYLEKQKKLLEKIRKLRISRQEKANSLKNITGTLRATLKFGSKRNNVLKTLNRHIVYFKK
jgi:hypothetical protein